jgi:hypothetical protein
MMRMIQGVADLDTCIKEVAVVRELAAADWVIIVDHHLWLG